MGRGGGRRFPGGSSRRRQIRRLHPARSSFSLPLPPPPPPPAPRSALLARARRLARTRADPVRASEAAARRRSERGSSAVPELASQNIAIGAERGSSCERQANSNEDDEDDEHEEDDMEEQSMTQKGAAAARKPPAAQRPSPVVGGARTRSAYKLTTRILRARAREVCPTPQRAAALYAGPALKPQQAGDADAAFFFYEPSEEDQNQDQSQHGRDQDQALPLKRQASLPMEHDLGPFFEFENDPAEGNDGDDVAEDGDGEQSSTGISSDHLEDSLDDGGSGGVSGGWVRGF